MSSTETEDTRTQERAMYPVEETRERLGGIGHSTFYELVKAGRIRTVKLGRRTFVMADEIDRFLATIQEGESR